MHAPSQADHAQSPDEETGDLPQMRLLILGARSFAEDVADWATDIPHATIAGFVVNDRRPERGDQLRGLPVYWIDDLPQPLESYSAVCALSTTRRRPIIQAARGQGLAFTVLRHPTAHVPRSVRLGTGIVAAPCCVVGGHAEFGDDVILGRGSLIGHHTQL